MKEYTVERGDYLALIARKFGIFDWRTVYEHPANEQFRKKRPDPNLLQVGDVVFIPDTDTKQVSVKTGKTTKFVLKIEQSVLNIIVKDEYGSPLACKAWTLHIDGAEYHGMTDEEGTVLTTLAPHVTWVELVLDDMPWTRSMIEVGSLDPIEDEGTPVVTGVQARLNNLGYECGALDGILGKRTTDALVEFQRTMLGLDDPTGEIDDETLELLVDEHGV